MSSRAVLAVNPGHDGTAALVVDGELVYSLEAEKDSGERHGALSAQVVMDALSCAEVFPDVVAIGGWHKLLPGTLGAIASGYFGTDPQSLRPARMLGRQVSVYSSSHERSHLVGGVAMSPFDPDGDLVVLVWEGVIGAFYRWRGPREPVQRFDVLDQPGARYSALYCVADPTFPDAGTFPPTEAAGKLMALVGLADEQAPSPESAAVVDSLLRIRALYPFYKARYAESPLYNCGVEDPEFCRAARYLSDSIFRRYREAAQRLFEPQRHPLVIVGGCGLNCDWNSAWRASGIFTEVFVPPCPNDSGSAIGTAVDAMAQLGGLCSLEWDAYRGAWFVHDARPEARGWTRQPLDDAALSRSLDMGEIVAWVQGRCEIGPRALGNRSLLASATDALSHKRLNEIKKRESYRPIAPVCLEEDLTRWFDRAHPDPHMLYFRQVRDRGRIPAVTHVDGSARVQSVSAASHRRLDQLLRRHRSLTGVGVLCNTSLNYPGRGFINRTSDLLQYCDRAGIDHVVIDDLHYRRQAAEQVTALDA